MDLDDAYANGAYIEGADAYPPRWAEQARAFRDGRRSRVRLGLSYGATDRERFDLFLPDDAPKGLAVFVHGGYWRAFGREAWSHLAAGPLARGWAVAMPSYTLAPDARISQITMQVASAVEAAAEQVGGPIALTGHSAGGHLVARMPAVLSDAMIKRLIKIAPISPLADLRPLLSTAMNADLQLDPAEAEAESPNLQPVPPVPVTIWVGAQERPVFLDQARWLAEAWQCGCEILPGRHHFDVIDDLADPESAMVRGLLGQG